MDDIKFNADIWRLNNSLVEMMLEVEKLLIALCSSVKAQDLDAMEKIIAKDKAINSCRDKIESECLRIIMKRHPFAMDLRRVLGAFKLVSDVERISDNIRDICEGMLAQKGIYAAVCQKSLDNLFKLGDNVLDGFGMAIKAFAVLDEDCIDKVILQDDVIDDLYVTIKEGIAEELENGSKAAKALITLVGATKHYEKIGDHCVNMVEWVRFIIKGERKDSKLANK